MFDKVAYVLARCIALIQESRLALGEKLQALSPVAPQRRLLAVRAVSPVGIAGLLFCVLLLGLWLNGAGVSDAETATVEVVEGLVEVWSPDGKWESVSKMARVSAGQRV
ncbi:MAG: hypothetical protein JSW55_03990, partial [Chloroflexota bacterium]